MATLNPLKRLHWNSFVCGLQGHVLYIPDEPELAGPLQTETPAGPAVRCLRCGAYVPHGTPATGPAEEAPPVLRGRALEDAFILRFLAVLRFLHFIGFGVLALAVWTFRSRRIDLAAAFYSYLPLIQPIASKLGLDVGNSKIIAAIESALSAAPKTLILIVLGLCLYALLELAEAVGLWLMKRWGEYVATVVTSLLVPVEIYEIVHQFSVMKLLALLVNLAAVAYLVYTKRLFRARGGHAAYEAERHADSLLEVKRSATS